MIHGIQQEDKVSYRPFSDSAELARGAGQTAVDECTALDAFDNGIRLETSERGARHKQRSSSEANRSDAGAYG